MFELNATQQKKASLNCGSTGKNQKHIFHISSREKTLGSTEFLSSRMTGAIDMLELKTIR